MNLDTTLSDFGAAYPGSKLVNELGNLRNDTIWRHIKHIRSVLFHRMHPCLTVYGRAPAKS